MDHIQARPVRLRVVVELRAGRAMASTGHFAAAIVILDPFRRMVALGSIADSLAQFSRTAALERLADVAETGFDIQRRIGSNFLITVVRSG